MQNFHHYRIKWIYKVHIKFIAIQNENNTPITNWGCINIIT